MKEVFYINHNKTAATSPILLVHTGDSHFSFALTDPAGTELYELAYCSFSIKEELIVSELSNKYPSLQKRYPARVILATKQAVLTPLIQSAAVPVIAAGQFGHGDETEMDMIQGWQNHTLYNIPTGLKNWIHQQPGPVKICHQFSIDIRQVGDAGDAGLLRLDIGENYFTLLAARKSRLLLCRHFPYTTPADILYYLLWTCKHYDLSQETVQLEISGLVDPGSSLMKELQLYFLQLTPRNARWGNGGSEYPAHFFAALNDAILCE